MGADVVSYDEFAGRVRKLVKQCNRQGVPVPKTIETTLKRWEAHDDKEREKLNANTEETTTE